MTESSTRISLEDATSLSTENGWKDTFSEESDFSLGSIVNFFKDEVQFFGRVVKETKCFVWILCCNGNTVQKSKKLVHTTSPESSVDVCCDGSTVQESEKFVHAMSPEPSVDVYRDENTFQESKKLVHATSPGSSVNVCCDGNTVQESEKLVHATSPGSSVNVCYDGKTVQESEKLVHQHVVLATSPETSVDVKRTKRKREDDSSNHQNRRIVKAKRTTARNVKHEVPMKRTRFLSPKHPTFVIQFLASPEELLASGKSVSSNNAADAEKAANVKSKLEQEAVVAKEEEVAPVTVTEPETPATTDAPADTIDTHTDADATTHTPTDTDAATDTFTDADTDATTNQETATATDGELQQYEEEKKENNDKKSRPRREPQFPNSRAALFRDAPAATGGLSNKGKDRDVSLFCSLLSLLSLILLMISYKTHFNSTHTA